MDARTFQRLVKTACDEGRAGDILFLAQRTPAVPAEALYAAARSLRDLMAYPAAIEVCDRLLTVDNVHYMALELRALCRARLHRDDASRYAAAADLDRALQLAQDQGEAPALIGRLFKQAWAESWSHSDAEPDTAAVGRNRLAALGTIDRLILAVDAYEAAYVRGRKRDLYPAINALTLAAIALDLLGPSHPRAAELRAVATRHLADVAKRVNASVAAAKTDEARYWALATKAEWYAAVDTAAPETPGAHWPLAGPGQTLERDTQRAQLLRATLTTAVTLAKQHLFWIDSTLQQFRLLRALGLRPTVVGAGLEVLEHAWRVAIHPDVPATRIVFLHLPEEGQARQFDPDWLRATFESAVERAVEAHGDCVAFLAGGRADILFASACQRRGLPYSLFLPSAPRQRSAASAAAAACGQQAEWHHAFERLIAGATPLGRQRGTAAPAQLMDRCLGLTESGAAKAPRGSLQCWLLDAARAYGASKVVVIGLDGFTREESVARTVEALRAAGGQVERIEAPRPEPVQATRWDTLVLSESLPQPPTAITLDAPPPCSAPPLPQPTEPFWLRDLCALFTGLSHTKTAQRWKAYERNPLAWELLSTLRLRFEPVEQLTPPTMAKTTTGFEVMGMTAKGQPYSELLAQARLANVDAVDLDLTILAYGLLSIRLLREHLHNQIGGRATWPIFTLNLNEGMLRAPVIDDLLEHYFDRSLKNRIMFELSETFPEGLLGIGNLEQRHNQIRQAIALLRKLAGVHGFLLILDDSMRIDPGLRAALQDLAYGTKADALFVADVFGLANSPVDVVAELQRYRAGGKPYVIEGIEKPEHYEVIRSNWPTEVGPVGLQGWIVKVHEPLAPFFEPLWTTDEPRGYRLTEAVIARVGPR